MHVQRWCPRAELSDCREICCPKPRYQTILLEGQTGPSVQSMPSESRRDVMAKAAAYSFVVVMIRRAWEHIYHEPMQIAGESSEAQFRCCMLLVSEKMQSEDEGMEWRTYLDLELKQVTPEKLGMAIIDGLSSKTTISEVGDLTPNQFRAAVLRVAWMHVQRQHRVAIPLPAFLRACLKDVFHTIGGEGRIRVGANRHFWRMFTWLQEVADETSWQGGQGLKDRNAGGRGPVALNPYDPKTLKVHLDRDYLTPPAG